MNIKNELDVCMFVPGKGKLFTGWKLSSFITNILNTVLKVPEACLKHFCLTDEGNELSICDAVSA